jgi:hypothetical protein
LPIGIRIKVTLVADPSSPRLADVTLQDFQRWAIRKYYTVVPFDEYVVWDGSRKAEP